MSRYMDLFRDMYPGSVRSVSANRVVGKSYRNYWTYWTPDTYGSASPAL